MAAPAVAQEAPPIVVRGDGVAVSARSEQERALAERIVVLYGEVHGVSRLRLGRAPQGPIRITLARLSGGGNHPSDAVGLASWGTRSIWLDPDRMGPTASLQAVLAHEVTHVVVGQATQGHVPVWFDEGVAEWMGAAYGIADRRSLARAAATGRLPHLVDLAEAFPHEPAAGRVAYAAARETIELMVAEAGPACVPDILAAVAGGDSFALAVRRATGHGPGDWDARLHASLAPGPGLVRRLLEEDPHLVWWVLLGLGGLLSIYAAVVRTRRARAKMARVEAAERECVDADAAMLEHEVEFGDEGWQDPEPGESWRG